MKRRDWIEKTLTEVLQPQHLEVIDNSHQHLGHAGYENEGSHFTVIIGCKQFENKRLLECHRIVYEALGDVVGKAIHALQIQVVR